MSLRLCILPSVPPVGRRRMVFTLRRGTGANDHDNNVPKFDDCMTYSMETSHRDKRFSLFPLFIYSFFSFFFLTKTRSTSTDAPCALLFFFFSLPLSCLRGSLRDELSTGGIFSRLPTANNQLFPSRKRIFHSANLINVRKYLL